MPRNSASARIQVQATVKKVNTRHSAAYTGLRTLITAPAATTVTTAKARKTSSVKSMRSSAEGGVGGAALGDLGFEPVPDCRSEEHTSELQSLMRISYAVFCLKKIIT